MGATDRSKKILAPKICQINYMSPMRTRKARFVKALVVTFLALTFGACSSSQDTGSGGQMRVSQQVNKVIIQNQVGAAIRFLFFSPSDSNHWGADILGSTRTLPHGSEIGFYAHYPDRCNSFDFMAIDENGRAYTDVRREICDGTQGSVVFSPGNLAPDAQTNFRYVQLEITNSTAFQMVYVFVSPADSRMLGCDMLDQSTILGPGNSFTLLVPAEQQPVQYDIIGADQDDDLYYFRIELDFSQERYSYAIEPGHLRPRN